MPDCPDLYLPCACDLLLHAAVHACYDGAFAQPQRDLLDLHGLIADLGDAAFWQALPARAYALDLARPLWYALVLVQRELGKPVPPAVLAALAPAAPPAGVAAIVPALVRAVLDGGPPAPAAAFALYSRSHWLRMPPRLLFAHLARKAWRRLYGRFAPPANEAPAGAVDAATPAAAPRAPRDP